MRITTRLTISMLTGETLEREAYEYSGPVEMACGATASQVAIGKSQQALMDQLTDQSKDIFGSSSTVFNDLLNTFAPTVAAGPNQRGFSATEKSSLDSSAITNTGEAYTHASRAAKEAEAAVGGGNTYLPGGADIGINTSVANEGAKQTASALNQIDQADFATGRQNYENAVKGIESAPSVFNPATEGGSAATNSGEAAAKTANDIATQDNSWVTAVTGALGGIVGDVATGGMSALAKGARSALTTVGQGSIPLFG
jgi:hypothetical protein